MDSSTHIVMGVGLSGLAALDPVIIQNPVTTDALIFGTIIGSVIPDIDTVLKIKNNATYIRNHRGITHSIPATLIWPIFITLVLKIVFPQMNGFHVWLWTFLAVFLHVFVDIFNSYGTQALRPITKKWIALGIINIFDPFIFGIHILGFCIWFFYGHSGIVFLIIYFILIGYYLLKIHQHHRAVNIVKEKIPNVQAVYLSPTMKSQQYHVAVRTDYQLIAGEIKGREVTIFDSFNRKSLPKTPLLKAATQDKNLHAFLSFSPIYRWEVQENNAYTEVRLIDLRYYSKGHYPFVAIAWVNPQLKIKSSFTGWVYSEEKLKKKLMLAINDYC